MDNSGSSPSILFLSIYVPIRLFFALNVLVDCTVVSLVLIDIPGSGIRSWVAKRKWEENASRVMVATGMQFSMLLKGVPWGRLFIIVRFVPSVGSRGVAAFCVW